MFHTRDAYAGPTGPDAISPPSAGGAAVSMKRGPSRSAMQNKRPPRVGLLAEPNERWTGKRSLTFCQRKDADNPSARGKGTTRVVESRGEIERIILDEGVAGQRYGIRASTVAAMFLAVETRRNAKAAQRLRTALPHFLAVVGDKAFSRVTKDDGLAIRMRIEKQQVPVPSKKKTRSKRAERAQAEAAGKANIKKTRPLSKSMVYDKLLSLRHLVDFAIIEHFTNHDPIGAQVKGALRALKAKKGLALPPKPEQLDFLRDHADHEECVVFDQARWSGMKERNLLEMPWASFDVLAQRIWRKDMRSSNQEREFGTWMPLRAEATIALCLLRVKRVKQGLAAEPRVFPHWKGHKAALRALRSIQFKHAVTSARALGDKRALVKWGDPTEYKAGFSYMRVRLSAGRAAAEAGQNRYNVAHACGLTCVHAADGIFGEVLKIKTSVDQRIRSGWITNPPAPRIPEPFHA